MNWKQIPGYEGRYEVSDEGQIKSLPNSRRKTELLMKLQPHVKSGHLLANLTDAHEGKWRQRIHYVHALVLQAFKGPCPAGMEGCHGDGNSANNKLDNLRWDTHQSNMQDRILHDGCNRGETNGQVRLTQHEVAEIKLALKAGRTQKELATTYGVARTTVSAISLGRNWSHV